MDRLHWDTLITMPYGERFRKHRRLMSQVLNSQAISVYRDLQMNNTKQLLKNLLMEPVQFDHHILRYVVGLERIRCDSFFGGAVKRIQLSSESLTA